MKKIILLLLCCAYAFLSDAQKEGNIWCFGYNATLDFNSGTAVPAGGAAIVTEEGSASISDPATGQLLFYTDGITVWDRNHNAMPASLATPLLGDPSSTCSGVIVPLPGSNHLYYVFTVSAQAGFFSGEASMCYSIVDMDQNGGYGDVVSANNVLIDSTTEKIAVTGSCDRSVYWIVGHRWDCDSFYAFRFTAAGLSPAVKSRKGIIHHDVGSGTNVEAIGCMKFSPDGKKLAVVSFRNQNTLQVFDFNWSTGMLSDPIMTDYMPVDLNDPTAGPYGCSFSPDNSKLYVSWNGFSGANVFQYDMNAGNGAALLASKTPLNGSQPNSVLGALQNGPDGKLYVAVAASPVLDVIGDPNAPAASCNYMLAGQSLAGNGTCYFGLPTISESFLANAYAPSFQAPDQLKRCPGDTIVAMQTGNAFTIRPEEGFDANADSSVFRFFPGKTTAYTVTGTGICSHDTTRFTIYVSEGPVADFVIDPSAPITADAAITLRNKSLHAQHYAWSAAGGALLSNSYNYTFPNPGAGEHCYLLTASDTLGCSDTAYRCFVIEDIQSDLFVPNTFTPNGDGKNDLFLPYGLHVTLTSLAIYNRYGEKVFFTTDIDRGWDGRYKGGQCDAGTYFYQVTYKDFRDKKISRKGDLELIR